jgi:hypothetical protein
MCLSVFSSPCIVWLCRVTPCPTLAGGVAENQGAYGTSWYVCNPCSIVLCFAELCCATVVGELQLSEQSPRVHAMLSECTISHGLVLCGCNRLSVC